MKFKVGDKVRILTRCSGTKVGKIYTLKNRDGDGDFWDDDSLWAVEEGAGGCNCKEKWELIKKGQDHSRKKETIIKFKVGDRVRIKDCGVLRERWSSCYKKAVGKVGTITYKSFALKCIPENEIIYHIDRNKYEINFISLMLEKTSKKGGIMSLLKKLLKPADALIDKYAMTMSGNLDMNSVLVQQALLDTDDFKKNLVELCKKEEEKEKGK